jgi:hypothetical protein
MIALTQELKGQIVRSISLQIAEKMLLSGGSTSIRSGKAHRFGAVRVKYAWVSFHYRIGSVDQKSDVVSRVRTSV